MQQAKGISYLDGGQMFKEILSLDSASQDTDIPTKIKENADNFFRFSSFRS